MTSAGAGAGGTGADFAVGLLDGRQVAVDDLDAELGGVRFQPSDELRVLEVIADRRVHQRPRAFGTTGEDLARRHQGGDGVDIGQAFAAGETDRDPRGLELLPQGARKSVMVVLLAPEELDAELQRRLHGPVELFRGDAQEAV